MAYTTIDDPSAYFKVQLYTGNGSTQAIAFNDTDTDMQPDLVWIKNRDATDTHLVFDSVRGAEKKLHISENPEPNESTDDDTLTAFGSDGFTLGDDDKVNTNTEKYVAWCWKESATAGFDIVSYSGNSTNRTISHSLSAVPHFYFVLARGDDNRSNAYHHSNTSAPETDYLKIVDTSATTDNNTFWNDTAPTSSVFSLGTTNEVNNTGNTYMAYLFSEKQGYSKFGKYTGNGNADGAFIYTGFRPAWIMFKRTDASGEHWYIHDNKRLGYNADNNPFYANDAAVEQTDDRIDILSNGFKLRTDNALGNASGSTQIYAAFAEAPFVNSNGVPCNAR
tara:strand:- start:2895 stop:3899 length:1005 start_codon:yes stop_codon:yes gene_type:complete